MTGVAIGLAEWLVDIDSLVLLAYDSRRQRIDQIVVFYSFHRAHQSFDPALSSRAT